MSSEEETTQAMEDDPEELARYKKFKWSLGSIGLTLSLVIGFTLCGFLIPGLSFNVQGAFWITAVCSFYPAAYGIYLHLEQPNCSVPQAGMPKTLSGADLC